MISIRKATESDIPQLEELFLIARQHTFYWEKHEKFKLNDYTKVTQGETVFVAENDQSTILGFISICELDPPPFIHHFFVAPDHQRLGIGSHLMHSLFSWLPFPYRLKCLTRNQNALAFYQKTNWVEIDQGLSKDGPYVLLELRAPSYPRQKPMMKSQTITAKK